MLFNIECSLEEKLKEAGVAYEALSSGKTIQNIDFVSMRNKMKQGGSIVLD